VSIVAVAVVVVVAVIVVVAVVVVGVSVVEASTEAELLVHLLGSVASCSVEIPIVIITPTTKQPTQTIIPTHNPLLLLTTPNTNPTTTTTTTTYSIPTIPTEESFSLVNIIPLTQGEVITRTIQMPTGTTLHTLSSLKLLLHPPTLLALHRYRLSVYTKAVHGVTTDDHNLTIVYFMPLFTTLEAG
jgi:hypothetical protein